MPPPTTPNIITEGTPHGQPRPDDASWQRSSIRIRRLPSNNAIPRARAATVTAAGRPRAGSGPDNTDVQQSSVAARIGGVASTPDSDSHLAVETPSSSATRPRSGRDNNRQSGNEPRSSTPDGGRRRSSSDPTRGNWDAVQGAHRLGLRGAQSRSRMPAVQEGAATTSAPQRPPNAVLHAGPAQYDREHQRGLSRRLSNVWQSSSRFLPTLGNTDSRQITREDQYESDMVDVLDTIDPEISTLNTLTNVQNSLFVPDLGRILNRRPTYTLTRPASQATFAGTIKEKPIVEEVGEEIVEDDQQPTRTYTNASLTSRLDDEHFAVLPHGERLEGWTAEDRAELNDHVRHLLHSKKEGFKRGMKGFGQYVRKPLGLFVTVYATLITIFGLTWVLFLIGWINVGGRKDYIVNIIDNVLVALFAIMGDGLAPFRAVDTYHMCFIAHYHHLTWRLRKDRSLPKLQNRNDLPGLEPSPDRQPDSDTEGQDNNETQYSVLNAKQQKRLEHHQKKFSRSHTFYKPHETTTHFAFPLRILVAVVVLLDCHSLLQIALGTCTWAIDYRVRPFALTTVILCCSLTCNITAGVLISIGDKRTRKKDVLERMFRQELTAQAMEKLQKRKQKESERNEALEIPGANLSNPEEEKEEKEERVTAVRSG